MSFVTRKCGVPVEIHMCLVCSLNRVQVVLNINGRKNVGQQSQRSYKEYINKDCKDHNRGIIRTGELS